MLVLLVKAGAGQVRRLGIDVTTLAIQDNMLMRTRNPRMAPRMSSGAPTNRVCCLHQVKHDPSLELPPSALCGAPLAVRIKSLAGDAGPDDVAPRPRVDPDPTAAASRPASRVRRRYHHHLLLLLSKEGNRKYSGGLGLREHLIELGYSGMYI